MNSDLMIVIGVDYINVLMVKFLKVYVPGCVKFCDY